MRLLIPAVTLLGLAVATAAPAEVPNRRPSDEERGKELYDRHCFQCHGEKVHGHGPATQALVHPVPDLVGALKVNDATINAVWRGKNAMPAFEASFDRADAKRVLQHMKRLADEEAARLKAGQAAPAPAAPDQPAQAQPAPAAPAQQPPAQEPPAQEPEAPEAVDP